MMPPGDSRRKLSRGWEWLGRLLRGGRLRRVLMGREWLRRLLRDRPWWRRLPRDMMWKIQPICLCTQLSYCCNTQRDRRSLSSSLTPTLSPPTQQWLWGHWYGSQPFTYITNCIPRTWIGRVGI
jgi:hypothetical protein